MKTRGSEAESKKDALHAKERKVHKEPKCEGKREASRDKSSAKQKRKPNIILHNPAVITLSQFEILNKELQEKEQNVSVVEKKSQSMQKSKERDSSTIKSKCPNKDSQEINHQSMFLFKTPQTKKQQNSMIFEVERKQARRFHHLQMCYNVMGQPLTIGPSSILLSKQLGKQYQKKSNPQQSGNNDGIHQKGIMKVQQAQQIHDDPNQQQEDNQNHLIPEKIEQNINAKEKKIKKRSKKRNQFDMLLKQNNGAAKTRSSIPSVQDKALTRNQLNKKNKFKPQIKKLEKPISQQSK